MKPEIPRASQEDAVRALYRRLLDAWNRRSTGDFAALYEEDGNQVGFDGTQVNGRAEIEAHLRSIFADHRTARYVAKIREVRFPGPGVAVLRAVAGMIPPGQTDLNPAVHAVQSLVAVNHDGQWQIALFQNTPAQFHARPEAAEQLTEELRTLL